MPRQSIKSPRTCAHCGGSSPRLAKGSGVFCSKSCANFARPRDSLQERVWSKVQKLPDEADCWVFTGTRNRQGYGRILVKGKQFSVHRLVYEWANGPIPPGMSVCHHCDNPPCCRPSHLFLGTPADNARDMIEKGRKVVMRGEAHYARIDPGRHVKGSRHGHAKLTEASALAIRERYDGKEGSLPPLAREFGVSVSSIWRVVNRKTWTHI